MKQRKIADILMQVLCIAIALAMLFPVLYALSVSFMQAKDILARPPNLFPPSVTLENYQNVFTRTLMLRYLLNSFLVAAVCSVARVVFASMAAYAYAFFEFRGKQLLFSLSLATMMIPVDVLIISNYRTVSGMGLINTYAGIMVVFLVSANNIFLLRQNFLTFARSLKEAAHIDGCNNLLFFFRILMPVNRPIIITVFISSFVNVWNQYVWPLIVTNRNEMRTVQVGITMLKDRESTVFGPVMAGAIVALIPTIILFAVFQKKIVAGMMSGAIKQ